MAGDTLFILGIVFNAIRRNNQSVERKQKSSVVAGSGENQSGDDQARGLGIRSQQGASQFLDRSLGAE